jgi:hypothetical protein
VSATLITRRC